ncbi:MAG: FISUMP domain-containing protein [Bacteroidota bacterium]
MRTSEPYLTILVLLFGLLACEATAKHRRVVAALPVTHEQLLVDARDGNRYGTVEVGAQVWFTENLRLVTPHSICYRNKPINCTKYGRLFSSSELETACPAGWRVPTLADWHTLKANFRNDSIYALLDTVYWDNPVQHTNESGLSIRGAGYQMQKRFFVGSGQATTFWINQTNKYDEYYHAHLYAGEGLTFEQSGYVTNEVLHAHPIEDLANRRFSIRCMCDKT